MQVAPTYRRTKQGHGLRSNEITRLEAQLEAQAAQSSLLHSRLTSTLDAMDDLKLSHQREIAVHKKSSTNAREKLQRFMEYASSVEQERDDCRDALLTLVQKVEEHSDLATWPHSRIRLPEFLEPIHNESSSQPNANAGPQEIAVGEQAKAITLWLRAELEKERMSHARTHEQAEREILALRAQLAQRDAELEACVVHRDHAALVNAAVPCNQDPSPHEVPTDDKSHRPISTLTPEDAVEILGLRVAKNRELDSEIKQLSQKLHQARMKDPTYLHIEEPVLTPQGLAGQRTPQSPDLRPLSPQDILSPYAMTPRYTSTPRAPAPSGDLPPRPPSIASESTVKGALTEIQKLEDEVRHLAAGIDVLETQRRSTRSLVAQTLTRLPSAPAPRDAPDDVLSQHTAVRHEPDRPVPDTAAALRVELDDVRLGAAQRERELLAEVERLQEELSRRVFGAAPAVGSLLDEDDAERSMGLRSPLAPVAVVWARSGDTATTTSEQGDVGAATDVPVEGVPVAEQGSVPVTEQMGPGDADAEDRALLIPLPASPTSEDAHDLPLLHHRPPTPCASAPTEGDLPPAGCTCSARLLVLERDLEETKRAVAERDEEIVDLRLAVNELRLATLGR